MSDAVRSVLTVESDRLPAPRLRPARVEDYEKIRKLAHEHSLDFPPREDWYGLWLHNPLTGGSGNLFPLGWVLETASDEIVGNFGNVVSAYVFQGERLVAAAGRFWFVSAHYRGLALQLMDAYLNQPGVDLFINNAVSLPALETFDGLLERVPIGAWDSVSYFPTADQVQLRLPRRASEYVIEACERFDHRFDEFWDELQRQNPEKLLAERSSRALTWHFAAPMRRRRLWILTARRNNCIVAYCMLTAQDQALQLPPLALGKKGLSGMRLVDFQSIDASADLLPVLLQPALARCTKEGISILENFGWGIPKMRSFDELAPCRQQLTNWKFFYRAVDAQYLPKLRDARVWDPSSYDGETSFE